MSEPYGRFSAHIGNSVPRNVPISEPAAADSATQIVRIGRCSGLTAAGDSPLTREEFTQWMMVCRALFLSGEDLQYKAGLLDRRAFDSYVAGARFWMASAGMRAAWKLSAGQFGS